MGERQAEVSTSARKGTSTFLMSFQVVDVQKPLLAVSKLVAAGNKGVFDEDPHILMQTGERIPMRCVGGTYEVEIWVRNPGFARQNGKLSACPGS